MTKDKIIEEKNMIGLAEAQLLGFYLCSTGCSLTELVISMGLTLEEFKLLKRNYNLYYLKTLEEKEGKTIKDILNQSQTNPK